MMAVVSSMLVERTERGDAMFMTMLARHCAHVLDTGEKLQRIGLAQKLGLG